MVFSHFQTQVWSEIINRGDKLSIPERLISSLLQISICIGYLTVHCLKFTQQESVEKHRSFISQAIGEILFWLAVICSSTGIRLGQVAEESLKNFRAEKDS